MEHTGGRVTSPESEQTPKLLQDNTERLVLEGDVNDHHVSWGSTDINERGESRNRREVPDVTVISGEDESTIGNWRVLSEHLISVHRYIQFNLYGEVYKTKPMINLKKNVNWQKYRQKLESLLPDCEETIRKAKKISFGWPIEGDSH